MRFIVLSALLNIFLINKSNGQVIIQTSKRDSIKQGNLDLLLANRSLVFNGLYFNAKKFDFVDFTGGSYRGSYFHKCSLLKIKFNQDTFSRDINFQEAFFSQSPIKFADFEFVKFVDCTFQRQKLESTNFTNSQISMLTATSTPTFINDTFIRCNFTNPIAGFFNNVSCFSTIFNSCLFDNVNMYTPLFNSSTFQNTTFQKLTIKGSNWGSASYFSKFTGCSFRNLRIIGGDFSYILIDSLGLGKSVFENVIIENAKFNNAKLNVWIKDNCEIFGISDFSNVNFKSSIIENSTFGNNQLPTRMNMKVSNFRLVEFRENVRFVKCDLTGSIWPTDVSNVIYVDCKGCPFPGCTP